MRRSWADKLWGEHGRLVYLGLAAILMLLTCLGSREIWTQEHRWADIVAAMFAHHDFLHPSLNGNDYYDKPLLSYWLIAGIASLYGKLTTWALRLPSAVAGLLAIGSIYSLGTHLKSKRLGLLAGWMLVTTFYFIFWARTSSADMLNMAGTLFAVAWYFAKKNKPNFFTYLVFFLILVITALCKGLVGPAVAVIAVGVDILLQRSLRQHLRWILLPALIPALIVYALPFWASTYFTDHHYQENGLLLVYRENILRYFHPFDHQGPLYTYFLFLPIYLLPWTVFFLPALWSIKARWQTCSINTKWLVWTVFILFVFFTLSGSRRNYYILPVVPFALLLTADWILMTVKRNVLAGRMAMTFFVLFFLSLALFQPLYNWGGGLDQFAKQLKQVTEQRHPWHTWQFVMLDPESKVRFYLALAPEVKNYPIEGNDRQAQTSASLLKAWPFLRAAKYKRDTIYISRQQYAELLQHILPNYTVVAAQPGLSDRILQKEANLPVAFIPPAIK